MLTEMRDYIKKQKRVSLSDIAVHFEVDAEVADGMLDLWVVKGVIERIDFSACSGKCPGCNDSYSCLGAKPIFYSYVI